MQGLRLGAHGNACAVHTANVHMKEGRKLHINSSRPGLIGCTDSIQVIKTIHDKVCNTDNIQLPHELLHGLNGGSKQSRILVPNGLHSRALKNQMALIPKHVLVTMEAISLSPSNPCPAA